MPVIHITNVDELQAMNDNLAASYELDNNIDASATSGWNSGLGFLPIGQAEPYFTGQLEGNNFTISELYINRVATNGLFSRLRNGAVVKNVKMIGATINGSGASYQGILVGAVAVTTGGAAITIDNCHTSGSVTGGADTGGLAGWVSGDGNTGVTISGCSSLASVIGTGIIVGGLIGDSGYWGNVDVLNCFATGNVTSNGSYVGGLIGHEINTLVSNCYATGNVSGTGGADYVGGFIGNSTYSIANCYARGNVSGDNDIGGFAGLVSGGTIDNCYSTGAPIGNTNVGGFCGDKTAGTISDSFWDTQTSGTEISDGGTGKFTAQMKTISTFTNAGWDFTTIWALDYITNNGYPFLLPIPPVENTPGGIAQII